MNFLHKHSLCNYRHMSCKTIKTLKDEDFKQSTCVTREITGAHRSPAARGQAEGRLFHLQLQLPCSTSDRTQAVGRHNPQKDREQGNHSVYFELSVVIRRSPGDVFAFLRDKDQIRQKENSPVLLIEKTTAGPTGVGTRYREVVQMLPFLRGEILSEITRCEPGRFLEEDFQGAGMQGHLAYQFLPEGEGTRLI